MKSFSRALLVLVFIGFIRQSTATSPIAPTWDQLIESADIVGLFECTGAGISCSRFRVEEVWRGSSSTGSITIHCTALVGERYIGALSFVRSQEVEIPSRSPGLGDSIGKTWLVEPDAEYSFHIVWGWVKTPDEYPNALQFAFPKFEGNVDNLRTAARSLPPRQRATVQRPAQTSPVVPREEIDKWHATLKTIKSVKEERAFYQWSDAVIMLSIADPIYAAKRVAKLNAGEAGFRWPGELAGFASAMCWYCPAKERNKTAAILAGSREPVVRFVGASRLISVGNGKGRQVLEKIAGKSDDLAEWANFQLASYGDAERMERAIDALATVGRRRDQNSITYPNYSPCIEVVLSNSAAASHVPQPGRPSGADQYAVNFPLKLQAHLNSWWEQNKERIKLFPVGTFPPE